MQNVILKLTGELISVTEHELAVLRVQHLVDDKPVTAKAPAAATTPALRADATDDLDESAPEAPAN